MTPESTKLAEEDLDESCRKLPTDITHEHFHAAMISSRSDDILSHRDCDVDVDGSEKDDDEEEHEVVHGTVNGMENERHEERTRFLKNDEEDRSSICSGSQEKEGDSYSASSPTSSSQESE